ncbi:hypothetical protein BDA99DRAFT_497480 [Phascolomyces articulosus]|uniref:Uncharacterized protein n=1 Tax=Phascolomyces articulosus TaxID=60185 RepID=A0AAD5KRH0_9FUNG|nr:hypothetical protein BDA99DRAFT_497480 [Phascolomyces articulosus]
MVTNTHHRLSGLSLNNYAFVADQNSFLSRGFQKLFVSQKPPTKCITNEDDTNSNMDDTSSFSSDEQLSPSVSLTPSTSSYSIPSSWCSATTSDEDVATLVLSMGVTFIWLHIQLQFAILFQLSSITPITNVPLSSPPSPFTLPQKQPMNLLSLTTTTITTTMDTFDSKSYLPSRYPCPDIQPVNDLVKNQVSIETSGLWHKYAQLPDRPTTRRRQQQFNIMDEEEDKEQSSQQHQAVQSLVQDVLAYLEEFSGEVAPELEALRPQLQNFIEL